MHTLSLLTPLLLLSPALAAVHEIEVGESGLTFEPQTTTASQGDVLIFKFYPQHDVAEADFSSPCKPKSGGFYSGTFSDTDNGKKKFVYTVNSTDPVFFYCTVQKHCQGGMVGAINAPKDGDNVQKFADAAKRVGSSEKPQAMSGGQLLEDGQIASVTASGGGATGSATAGPSASGSGAASSGSPTTTPAGTASGGASGATSSPPPTGAADVLAIAPASGLLAAVLGFGAWFL